MCLGVGQYQLLGGWLCGYLLVPLSCFPPLGCCVFLALERRILSG